MGYISDKTLGRGICAFFFLLISSPLLLAYHHFTASHPTSYGVNILMMILVGAFINGPVGLITTAVSQDLGNHPSLMGDQSLKASVVGFVDGFGSLGAALQGVLLGYISSESWENVFTFLGVVCLFSALSLVVVIKREVEAYRERNYSKGNVEGFIQIEGFS